MSLVRRFTPGSARRLRSRFGRWHDRTALQVLAPRAAHMRRAATPTEARLWSVLRRAFLGVRFRRQVVLGRFIVDFYAPSAKLVIEVDGPIHLDGWTPDLDRRRDELLSAMGCRVIRVTSDMVAGDMPVVLGIIATALRRE